MFSDLNRLQKGDVFYLKILDETLAYMILDINTVLPEDTSKLAIDPDRDSCTLVTCTPYGVNTHRLLVRGERIAYETAVSAVEDAIVEEAPASTWTEEYLKGIGYGLIGIASLTALFGALHLHERDKKQKQRRRYEYINSPQLALCTGNVSAGHSRTMKGRGALFRPERKRGKHEK